MARPQPRNDRTLHLPEPVPFSPNAPFVGNRSTDDNIRENVQVAIWNATQQTGDNVSAEVAAGHVTLTGFVRDKSVSRHCEDTVRAVAGVKTVTNRLRSEKTGAAFGPSNLRAGERPMLISTHFCQIDPASIAAAIQSGGGALAQALGSIEVSVGLVVIYRNRRAETLTVEVGSPTAVGAIHHANGLRVATLRLEPSLEAPLMSDDLSELLAAQLELREDARRTGRKAADYFLQPLRAVGDALVPALEIHLPVDDVTEGVPASKA